MGEYFLKTNLNKIYEGTASKAAASSRFYMFIKKNTLQTNVLILICISLTDNFRKEDIVNQRLRLFMLNVKYTKHRIKIKYVIFIINS